MTSLRPTLVLRLGGVLVAWWMLTVPPALAQASNRNVTAIPAIREFLADGGFGQRHAAAPEALDQFGQLTGIWDAVQEMPRQDGSWAEVGSAIWTWRYALGGFAIQDLWYQPADRLPAYLGSLGHDYLLSALRTYDVRTGTWKIAWTANGMGRTPGDDFGTLEGQWDGVRLALTSPPGEYGLQRVVFQDLRPDSFTWVSEFSTDGGATWTAVMRVSARRREATR